MFTGYGQIGHISWAITPHHRFTMLRRLVIFCLNHDLYAKSFYQKFSISLTIRKRYPALRLMIMSFSHKSIRSFYYYKRQTFDHDGFNVYRKICSKSSFLHLSKHSNIAVTNLTPLTLALKCYKAMYTGTKYFY